MNSFGGYRAVMQHFIASFHDAHMNIHFELEPTAYRWPNFLVRYIGGRYVVVASERRDADSSPGSEQQKSWLCGGTDRKGTSPTGVAISGCDGKSIDRWVNEVAEFEGGQPGLESTKAAIARLLFVDSGSPLYPLPTRCKIGDRDVKLNWDGDLLPQARPVESAVPTL